jgi:hypothetical protein
MARGFESKSVESQQSETRSKTRETKRTAAEVERDQRRHTLEMSRRRITNELATTKSPMRRSSLEAALKHLDSEIGKL